MRAVIQRVSSASVSIENSIVGQINSGLVILLGIELEDNEDDVDYLCKKISQLRIFSDDEGKMNLNIEEIEGNCLVISQFTLHASTKKGNRPSFIKAARPDQAIPLYDLFLNKLSGILGIEIQSGEFGAMMDVSLVNEGPVTIIIDSKNKE